MPTMYLFATIALSCPAVTADDAEVALRRSVVKLSVTYRTPDYARPWRRSEPFEGSGTGVVIPGNRILTNAHVANHASRILVSEDNGGSRPTASVEYIAPAIDLAVLRVDDPAFFDHHPPMPRAEVLPSSKDTVLVYGYPKGGEDLSVTRGIVSRIEYDNYYYDCSGLRIQVDAAVNPGNSGGPALVAGKMVGIVFSTLQESENIGYVIPLEEIDIFLADVADGRYDGKGTLFGRYQNLENDAMRAQVGVGPTTGGVVVVAPDRPASSPLQLWDVITAIGSDPIDSRGTVRLNSETRVAFGYAVQRHAAEGRVRLSIMREGKPLELDVPVYTEEDRLIPFLYTGYPSYFVWGPLVFSAATDDFIDDLVDRYWAKGVFNALTSDGSPLATRRAQPPSFPGEQLVVVAAMFPHAQVRGDFDPVDKVVESVDGTPVKNLRHLGELLRASRNDRVIIKFRSARPRVLVLDRRAVENATEEVLSDNGIRRRASPDLHDLFGDD